MEQLYALALKWTFAHGLHGVFLFMLGESAGLPLPTQLGFLTAEGMVDVRLCEYWQAFVWIVMGHLTGAGLSYHLGRAGDCALCRHLAHRPEVLGVHEKLMGWYAKYGAVAVLFGRLVGHVRPWSSFAAGLARVPVLLFWLWTSIGTVVFTVALMWLTAVGYGYWQQNRHLTGPILITMFILFYGLPLCKAIEHVIRQRRKARAEKKAA